MKANLNQNQRIIEHQQHGVSSLEGVCFVESVISHYIDKYLSMDERNDQWHNGQYLNSCSYAALIHRDERKGIAVQTAE